MRWRISRFIGALLLGCILLLLEIATLKIYGASFDSGIATSSTSLRNKTSVNEQVSVCQVASVTEPFTNAGYCFLQGLITPTSGLTDLVTSREGECFTTVYKNSLAAMAFTHQGEVTKAERIFNFFQSQLTTTTPISGFRQAWDPCTSLPLPDNPPTSPNPYWEGDNAFLLLALNYYAQTKGSYGNYNDLAIALKTFLTSQADVCGGIIAEGTADLYAALVPFGNDWSNWQALSKLYRCFFNSVNYPGVADHTVRGALVFGDATGFGSLNNFERTETWQHDGSTVITWTLAIFEGQSGQAEHSVVK